MICSLMLPICALFRAQSEILVQTQTSIAVPFADRRHFYQRLPPRSIVLRLNDIQTVHTGKQLSINSRSTQKEEEMAP